MFIRFFYIDIGRFHISVDNWLLFIQPAYFVVQDRYIRIAEPDGIGSGTARRVREFANA
uniref:Uncharacterized protein n=1 Tax=Candidatus Kentrum sp. LFY TaxID=2126342 RepID=A0A450WRX2_9GAMM|nr:MAG: hypothetical protein BECKLFY1418C_GA0070996_106212 [Candidatus Kentron sp. LFY]